MTQEEKAKAYDEALDRAKAYHRNELAGSRKEMMEYIFPELRESEDEKIRKFLIDYFTSYKIGNVATKLNGYRIDDILAYLEKQKERGPLTKEDEKMTDEQIVEAAKSAEKKTEFGELVHSKVSRGVNSAYGIGFLEGAEWARKQKEQKPAEWSEDWREEDIQTRFAFYTYKDEDGVLYLSNVFVEEASRNHGFGTKILIAAEKVAEIIGATTISLKVKQDSPANAWYRKNGYGYVAFEDGYDWLEKNLEYMKPNKQEWSEEDEDMLNSCISSIEEAKENRYAYKETDGDTSYDHEIAWLKSLRNRVGKEFLQPHWKPSEEQMDVLLNTEGMIRASGYPENAKVLASLYEALKKL